MKQYKIAAILMMFHGGLMELGGCLAFIPVLFMGTEAVDMSRQVLFIVPYFQENVLLLLIMSGIYGIVRLIGAVGLWRNRLWGLALSIINCIVTMVLMIFMLPAGVIDGILACTALILILTQYFGNRKIIE